jgi:hypothetical protein
MGRLLRAPLTWLVAALATAGAVLLISGGGDDGEGGPPPEPPAATTAATTTQAASDASQDALPMKPMPRHRAFPRNETQAAVHRAVTESKPARLNAEQRGIARIVRSYVAALNARDGHRACRLFAPGATSRVDFPRDRGGCAQSLSASIGYRDPRGFPVYEHSRVARIRSVTIDGPSARVVATTVTRFAGGREPSVEDDLVYLQEQDGRWLIVQPSAALYRAIGVGNIPPSVLAPPK